MAINKKQYYELDDVGFVGTQDKRSDAQIKKDIELTVQYIKSKKTRKVLPLRKIAKAK